MNERQTIDRGWYYVIEPDADQVPPDRAILADDGRILTRRLHGHPGRIEVIDASGAGLPVATWLRAAGAVGRAFEARGVIGAEIVVRLGPAGTVAAHDHAEDGRLRVHLDGVAIAAATSHHPVEDAVAALLADVAAPRRAAPPSGALPSRPVPRALFFESLMNTDMPHNDKEISQGVLHVVSPLRDLDTEVVMVNAKMSITGGDRDVHGLTNLRDALADGRPIQLVGITLLEGYWEGVVHLIRTIRELGCRAHIAVGGVMPSLAPEHVAAHLPEVSFVCRGAGEYFTPRLARILGPHDVDDPLTEAQRHALLAMDGMIVVDRAAGRLLSCRSDRTLQVEELDKVQLDLSFVQPRHIEGGIEISTSRGCIHKCSFCSILGRESYQARSAGSVFDVLEAYHARFRELFGERIPPNSFRVHFSDDDFACDKARAAEVFRGILDTPFRLSSVQVAIGDLCRRVDGKLLAEPDPEILDAIKPECFADHGRPIPKVDFFEDHKSRTWSSFLQIGVETYSDKEIARLGKGYKRVHVRTIVAELARRGIHMDGYFILSNVDTEASDLVDVFTEVARLKLRFPEHFHMRFPVVQHLVSYFTAASHRRHLRRGRGHVMKLRGHAQVPGHAELDYPFVDHDEPLDPWVRDTVAHTFVTDHGMYTENLAVLSAMWKPRYKQLEADDPDRVRIGRLLRKLDDRPRRVVFEMLRQAWLGDDEGWPDARLDKEACLETAERVLGPQDAWMPVFRHLVRSDGERRLVVAADLPADAREAALDLLLSSDERATALQVHAVHGAGDDLEGWLRRARQAAKEHGRRAPRLIVDGRLVDGPRAAALAPLDVEVQWVLGVGDAPVGLDAVRAAGLRHRVVLAFAAADVPALAAAVERLLDVGELVLEPVGAWTAAEAQALGRALFAAGPRLRRSGLPFDELVPGRERSGLGLDVAVDRDGSVTRADLLRPGEALARAARLGRLDDVSNVDRHFLQLAEADHLRRAPSLDQVARQLAPALKVLRSFVGWLQADGAPVRSESAAPAP